MGANLNFVRQQGFTDTTVAACEYQYPALMWQPRILAILVVLGILLETGWVFLALSAVLWWNVVFPRFNPFDLIYDHFFLKKIGHAPTFPAPAPRRFSQAIAATFMLSIGLAMLKGHAELAWTLQLILLFLLMALVFGRFCMGAYLWHQLTGKRELASKTLPWSGGK